MTKSLFILLAVLLAGCSEKVMVDGQLVRPTSDPTLKTSYRVVTDGQVFRVQRHDVLGWEAASYLDFPTIEDACARIDREISWEITFRRFTDRKAKWTNVPPILNCDK